MNGLALKQAFLDALNEASEDMVKVDLRRIYDSLDAAALLYVRETKGITKTCTITTVAGQQSYDLSPDFIRITFKDRHGRLRGKYVYGDNTAWPAVRSYDAIFLANRSESQETPTCFAVIDKPDAETMIEGTTTAAGAVSGGKAQLTDASAAFSGQVYARDTIVNTTRNSSGVVVTVTDDTHIQCALFPDGINSWRIGDGYRIQPQARRQVMLDAPSQSSGHFLILPYAAQQSPVYCESDAWRLDAVACRAIAQEAAYLFAESSPKLKPVKTHHQAFVDAIRAERTRMAQRILQGR